MNLFSDDSVSKILYEIDLARCRLCQENEGCIEFITNLLLFERIKLYTHLNFDNDLTETMPKSICTTCHELINNFFQFQKNCLKIDEQLKQLLFEQKKLSEKLKCKKISQNQVKRPILRKRTPNKNQVLKFDSVVTEIKSETKIKSSIQFYESDSEWTEVETPCDTSPINDIHEFTTEEDEKIPLQQLAEKIEEKPTMEIVKRSSRTVRKARDKTDNENQSEYYKCPIGGCTKTCPNKGALRSHKYHQHGIRKFLCTACGKSFRALCNLKSHEAVHLQTKPFQCPKCTQCFGYATNLKVHIKLHHEGHRYYCTKCGKAFLTSCTLKRHELIHIGQKDFQCNIDLCTSAFYTHKELIKHQKYHYDIRAYFCNICYKTFVAKDHLTVHMRSHTGERPYICHINGCAQAFVTSGKVRRHQRTVHRLNL